MGGRNITHLRILPNQHQRIVEMLYLHLKKLLGRSLRFCLANIANSLHVQVNSKATLMFSGLIDDEVHENVFLPDLPYVTDEHGNIYFQVKNGEDTMRSLTSDNNFVDWVAVLEDEEDEDDSDMALGDWAKLETMRASHPMYFAKKLAEVASDDSVDWMEQPPASLAIQGLIRPAFIEEHSVIRKHLSDHKNSNLDGNQVGENVEDNIEELDRINGHKTEAGSSEDSSNWAEDLEQSEIPTNGATFYKLEMIRLQLFSSNGNQVSLTVSSIRSCSVSQLVVTDEVSLMPFPWQTLDIWVDWDVASNVEIEDFMKAQPDAIAHSATKIISRLKAGGEKTTQALKSLCWRLKGIQVEEAVLIGVDSLGFDLRICSGTQVETVRFSFDTRATSEYSAERQLNDLLFPRIHPKPPKFKQTHQNEC
ncbi:hypothetical protein FEM48_Zijuj03G0164100 [Ziziphus jujuba var. spinosa]|uniref:Uncharacterized protein n=1 Tax=Ziziphus jujuba var. spinosa TaxID=714518 RepID=A0A978VRD2_ZIZJJ|nr:hypothetical protein FEM48_Zijuj03G0164100 [Ziziphus jujuba var. spinosa]